MYNPKTNTIDLKCSNAWINIKLFSAFVKYSLNLQCDKSRMNYTEKKVACIRNSLNESNPIAVSLFRDLNFKSGLNFRLGFITESIYPNSKESELNKHCYNSSR